MFRAIIYVLAGLLPLAAAQVATSKCSEDPCVKPADFDCPMRRLALEYANVTVGPASADLNFRLVRFPSNYTHSQPQALPSLSLIPSHVSTTGVTRPNCFGIAVWIICSPLSLFVDHQCTHLFHTKYLWRSLSRPRWPQYQRLSTCPIVDMATPLSIRTKVLLRQCHGDSTDSTDSRRAAVLRCLSPWTATTTTLARDLNRAFAPLYPSNQALVRPTCGALSIARLGHLTAYSRRQTLFRASSKQVCTHPSRTNCSKDERRGLSGDDHGWNVLSLLTASPHGRGLGYHLPGRRVGYSGHLGWSSPHQTAVGSVDASGCCRCRCHCHCHRCKCFESNQQHRATWDVRHDHHPSHGVHQKPVRAYPPVT
jgi:hypothetical protein